jgi:apolipoprotein D and lipocalin family protein
MKLAILSIFSLILITLMTLPAQPLETVPSVDLEKYAGTWYEIAAYPQRFQRGCHSTTATYTLHPKGYVQVENRCRKGSFDGKKSGIRGKAFVEKGYGNARLKVQFFWPFRGKYWIIDLAEDYRYAVVSHPSRKYLWILARNSTMDTRDYEDILRRLKAKGFDLSKLERTPQRP